MIFFQETVFLVLLVVLVIIVCVGLIILILRSSVSPQTLYVKAVSEFEQHNYKKAKKLFIRAIKRKADFFEAMHRLGLLYYKVKDFEEAQNCFQHIVDAKPASVVALYNLALAMQMQKKYEEAKAVYKKVLSLEPNDYDSNYNLALIKFDLKDYKQALPLFENAAKIQPAQVQAVYFALRCKAELCDFNDLDSARAVLDAFQKIEIQPNLPADFFTQFAKSFAKLGMLEESYEYCKKSLQTSEEDPELYKLFGLLSLLKGDRSAARVNLQIAAQLDSSDKEVYNILNYT